MHISDVTVPFSEAEIRKKNQDKSIHKLSLFTSSLLLIFLYLDLVVVHKNKTGSERLGKEPNFQGNVGGK